ncbi:hypothetical protein BaRGS_00025883 [Batillaria attramentaria]|uniref:N-acetyltransferase domain-containing protein n=1 Tax=Batillaria attramentaria TaxID=370345 RepID=A0ABD0K7J1_9CAEN
MTFTVREATENDCDEIMRLIKDLAEYEKMLDQVSIKAEGNATAAAQLVGYVMYYYTYSPWRGRACCMEDIYVEPAWRGKGVGTALWAEVTKSALSMGCSFVQWVVLDWNKPTIEYYKRQGAEDISEKEGWLLFRMTKPAMTEFVTRKTKQS